MSLAIAPWSWTASNGTASASETQRAYNSLTAKLNTSNFSYKVWNDLIAKINTVNTALGRSWKTDFATFADTRAAGSYTELTAARFNSARLNTNYPSWRWNYDEEYEGYIGRTDVRGIGQYGESGADTVFGVYILELVARLNTVIGIINGTQDTVEMDESVPVILLPETEITKLHSEPFDALRQRMRLRATPTLTSENLPTLTLHYRIPTALYRAILELESIASKLEGNLRHSLITRCTLAGTLPVSMSQSIRAGEKATAHLRALPVGVFTAIGTQEISEYARLHRFGSIALNAINAVQTYISGKGVVLKTTSIGWHHVRIIMEPDSTLVQERKQAAEGYITGTVSGDARFIRLPSTPLLFSNNIGYLHGIAVLTPGSAYGITIHHDVSTVQHSAQVNLVTLMESMKVDMLMSPLGSIAVLEREHVSTMLEALLSSAVIIVAEPEVMITGAMEKHIDILLDMPVTLSGGNSVALNWDIPVLLENTAEVHAPQAARAQYRERIKLSASAKANVPAAASAEVLSQTVLSISGTITRDSRPVRFSAHGRNGHNIIGELFAARSGSVEAGDNITEPQVTANLDKYGLAPVSVNNNSSHNAEAELAITPEITALSASDSISVEDNGDLGYVMYADMNATNAGVLVLNADIETKGAGWQYPVIVDTDAAIFQVWLTEQCRNHLYLDPYEAVHHAEITNTVSAGLSFVIRAGMEREVDCRVGITGQINTVRRTDWEYPVKTDNDLYIPQALYTRPAGQYKLEVL